MPGRDRTGPEGRGSLTGRGLGGCADGDRLGGQGYGQGYGRGFGPGRGRGFGRGRGGGRGFGFQHGFGFGGGRRFNPADDAQTGVEPREAAPTTESAVTRSLVAQITRLADQMRALEARLAKPKPEE